MPPPFDLIAALVILVLFAIVVVLALRIRS